METRPKGENSPRVQEYIQNASYCQRKAAAATDHDVRLAFAQAAQRWRELSEANQEIRTTWRL
jgi:hypothetical protein